MYVERDLEKKIKGYLSAPEIISVVGARQAGKTTLLKHLQAGIQDSSFLTFEDIEIRELFDLDIKSFIELYIQPARVIFIDEFQYSKKGGQGLKFIYDTVPGRKLIISGSSSLDLTIKAVKHLTGRILSFTLYPFSFREVLRSKDERLSKLFESTLQFGPIEPPLLERLQKYYREFVIYGGYPRVATAQSDEEKKEILKNIFQIYLLRDVRDILGLVDDYKMLSLVKALALQAGQAISYDELANLTQQNTPAIKRQMNFLEKTYIASFLRPYFRNRRTELVKNPKVYFLDTGLRNAVIRDFKPVSERQDKGALYENSVFSELLKKDRLVKYWRTKSKAEVDFVVDDHIPLEVKSSLSKPLVGKSLHSFIAKYQPDHAFILNESLFEDLRDKKSMIHWRYLFSGLNLQDLRS
jgi:predicted AAA+ superfamily ATPase